jgi:signal transduction histidine kinase
MEEGVVQHVTLPQMEEKIARCRLVFSGLVTVAVLLDPFQPLLNPWRTLMGSAYVLERDFLGTILLHLLYSTVVYGAFRHRPIAATRFTWLTTSTDVLFAVAIAFVTEGRNSLFYPFISFAIVESGLRWGLRRTLMVTAAGAGLWIAMIVMWAPDDVIFYLMRPLYLMVVGYLIGYLGEQRLALESEVRTLEANEERLRIARDIHDGCMQLLAALNLQLESCQRLVRAGQTHELLADLRDLQESVNSEHDELRVYLRALAGVSATDASSSNSDPRVRLRLDIDTSAALVDHVLRIVREGVTNIRRHADAREAEISATMHDTGIRISIDDDGRGFAREGDQPWSILSRVTELGGSLEMRVRDVPGAHLMISLPGA